MLKIILVFVLLSLGFNESTQADLYTSFEGKSIDSINTLAELKKIHPLNKIKCPMACDKIEKCCVAAYANETCRLMSGFLNETFTFEAGDSYVYVNSKRGIHFEF